MSLVQKLGKSGGDFAQWEIDWTKVLCLAGGTAAAAGLLWYLLHDDGEEEAMANGDDFPKGMFYQVCDPKGAYIGVRSGPDVNSARTGMQLSPMEVFPVSEVVTTDEEQTYLKLADGRGWAFTHSSRDGRRLCQRLSAEEVSKMQDMPRGPSPEAFPAIMEKMMRENPGLVQEILSNPEMAAGLGNPETMAQYSAMLQETLLHAGMQGR